MIIANDTTLKLPDEMSLGLYGYDDDFKSVYRIIKVYPYRTVSFFIDNLVTSLIINSATFDRNFKCRFFLQGVDYGEFKSNEFGQIFLHLSDPQKHYCDNGITKSHDPDLYRLINDELHKYSVDFSQFVGTSAKVKLAIFGVDAVKITKISYELYHYPTFDNCPYRL